MIPTQRETASPAQARLLLAALLGGIFLIKLPVLIAVGLLVGILLFLWNSTARGAVDRLSLLILANLLFWLVSGFSTGALTPAMLAQPSYYSNEGRVFLTYFGFVTLAACTANAATLRDAVRLVAALAVLGLLLFAVWFLAKPELLSVGRARNFGGFLTSHTGSGTFFSVLALFLMVYGARAGSRVLVLLGVAGLLPVLGSGSRESLVALVAVLLWYLRRSFGRGHALPVLALVAALGALMPVLAPHTWERTARLFSPQTVQSVAAQVERMGARHWEPGQEKDLEGEEFNVLSRVLYWGYALQRFADSPFLGAGFGRFNDRQVHFAGTRGVYYFGVSAQNSPATLHAHNTYLHMLAETGVFGLLLLLAVWRGFWRRTARAMREFSHLPAVLAYYEALQSLLVFLLVAAFFGHALCAPIDAIPTLALLGIGAAFQRAHAPVATGRLAALSAWRGGRA